VLPYAGETLLFRADSLGYIYPNNIFGKVGKDDQPNWENGDPLTFINIEVCSFCNENTNDLDYVVMHSWNGKWSFSSQWNSRKYIVEIPCGTGQPNNFCGYFSSPPHDDKIEVCLGTPINSGNTFSSTHNDNQLTITASNGANQLWSNTYTTPQNWDFEGVHVIKEINNEVLFFGQLEIFDPAGPVWDRFGFILKLCTLGMVDGAGVQNIKFVRLLLNSLVWCH